MPYQLPSMDELCHFVHTLDTLYQQKRQEIANSNGFIWNFIRSEDSTRQADIHFIQLIVTNLTANESQYPKWDRFFADKRYEDRLPSFIKYVIAGTLFYVLIPISNSYSDEHLVKNKSALATLILDIFGVEALSNIPVSELTNSLKFLLRYLDNAPKGLGLSPEAIHWHKLKFNDVLINDIKGRISTLCQPSSSLACH